MNKNEFLQKLKEDLTSLSDEERQDALKYYEEYFADAEENEKGEETVTEFVSPDDLADRIEAELTEITERENRENVIKLELESDKTENEPPELTIEVKKEERNHSSPKNNNLKLILILCTIPFWLPLVIAIASVSFGVFMAVLGIAFAVAAIAVAGFIMIGAGFISMGTGVIYIFADITSALFSFGAGFIVLGLGIIIAYAFTKLTVKVFRSQFKFANWIICGISKKIARQVT